MNEQDYINVSDLRTWRCISALMGWLTSSEAETKLKILIWPEISRLEKLVDKDFTHE